MTSNSNKLRRKKRLLSIVIIVGLLSVCAFSGLFVLNYVAWRIPPPPRTRSIALADLDGDGDLDAFLANGRNEAIEPNTVLFNDGNGRFHDSGQQLGDAGSSAVALGDLDGDGDSDAFVGNRGPDEIWLNDGRASFTDSGQKLGDSLTRFLYLADLDGDSDLDAFAGSDDVVTGKVDAVQVWYNEGNGRFR